MTRRQSLARSLALLATLAPPLRAQDSALVPRHFVTRWADSVTPARVLPGYPRPQLRRRAWINLNGLWDYAIRDSGVSRPRAFDGKILVPFPVESQLSGVRRAVTDSERLWYHRTVTLPREPRGTRWLLHFGAVDWDATVNVNGRRVGEHRGGYDPFSFDITSEVIGGPRQDLAVGVWDPTDRGEQPRGKQVLHPRSIWYTAVTGIWQTVWLEPVPATYISGLEVTPHLDQGTVTVRVAATGTAHAGVTAVALAGGKAVASGAGSTDSELTLHLANPHPWSPADPFLYQLRVRLASGDSAASYFGMRSIAVHPDSSGALRLFLNDRPLFEFGTLDQGWWPGGLYTPPSDAAIANDLRTLKRLGMNLIRKHVKVEPERWYYLCDSLGLLVWQDMPSGDNTSVAGQKEFEEELERVVAALRNHPAIVMWVPFNEGWGQHDTERYVSTLRALDSTRLVDNASGWTDEKVGDVQDIHDYPGPSSPAPDGRRAPVLGEFGGLGLPLAGHTWVSQHNWGYRRYETLDQLWNAYRALIEQLRLLEGEGLAAAVYTQTTDVEVEVNGLMTYDRAVVKLPPEATALDRRLYDPPPVIREVVPTSRTTPQRWRYTTTAPAGAWYAPDYADSAWQTGEGGFGTDSTPGAVVRTQWASSDIWVRRSFELPAAPLAHPYLRIHHDDDAEVYVNGTLVATLPAWTTSYAFVPLDSAAAALLHPGTNTLAIHVHQRSGGQYVDAGIDEVIDR